MTNHPSPHGTSGVPDDQVGARRALTHVLNEYADGYEVDRDRVLARLSAAGAGRATADAASPSWFSRSLPMLSAAAVAAVLFGVVVGVRWDRTPDPDVTTAQPPATASQAATPTATPSVSRVTPTTTSTASVTPTASTPAPGMGSPTGTVPGTAVATRQGGNPAPSRAATSQVPVVTVPPANGSVGAPGFTTGGLPGRLVLGDPQSGDWLIVGSRRDGRVIRAKHGSGVLTFGELVSGTFLGRSPVSIDWSGGMPEQDRSGDTTWRCGTNTNADDAVLRIGITSLPSRGVLTLYLGSGPNDAASTLVKVEARVEGGDLGQIRTTSSRVQVTFPSGSAGKRMTVELTPPRGSSACLAAAVLE